MRDYLSMRDYSNEYGMSSVVLEGEIFYLSAWDVSPHKSGTWDGEETSEDKYWAQNILYVQDEPKHGGDVVTRDTEVI